MSKRIRTLVIAVVAVVLLLGALLVLLDPFGWFGTADSGEGDPSATATTTTTIPLLEKTEGDEQPVLSVEIRTPDEQFAVKPDADGVYTVEGYADLPVAAGKIESLLSAVADIYASRKITEEPANAADFGFDEPLAAVTVAYTDETIFSFELGDLEPGQSGYYFRKAGESAIYLVDTTFAETLMLPSTDYIGLNLITEPAVREDDDTGAVQLMALELSGSVRPQPVSLRYRQAEDSAEHTSLSEYIVTAPYLRAAKGDIKNWKTGLNTLTASGVAAAHPTAEQMKEYGLSDPRSVARLTFAVYAETDGTVTVYNEQTLTLRLGGKAEDGAYYAMLDGVDVVYRVSASNVPWAEMTYDDITAPLLFTKNIQQVSAVSITVDGMATRFELTHNESAASADEALTVTANGTVYPTENFRKFYEVLMQVTRFSGADGAVGSGEPYLVVRLDPVGDGAVVEAKLYPQTANRYVCVMHDGDTYLVSAGKVDDVVKQLQNYLSGQDVVA